jgi:hypothetical protein
VSILIIEFEVFSNNTNMPTGFEAESTIHPKSLQKIEKFRNPEPKIF